jgi:hypothetical protein
LGEVVLDANDYFIFSYKDGLFKCSNIEHEVGFINSTGKEIIPCRYSRTTSFERGLCLAVYNNKIGLIDNTGQTIVPFEFDVLNEYFGPCPSFRTKDDLYIVSREKKYGVIDKKGDWVIKNEYDHIDIAFGYFIVMKEKKYGIMDHQGNYIVPLNMDRITKAYNDNDIPLFKITQNLNDGYYTKISGIVDKNGIIRIQPKYHTIGDDDMGISSLNNSIFAMDPRPSFLMKVTWKEGDDRKYAIADLFGNIRQ